MATCKITAGVVRNCGYQSGGIEKLWLANISEVDDVDIDADNVVTGVTLATGATFYSVEFEPDTGQRVETPTVVNNKVGYIQQDVNFQMSNIDNDGRDFLNDIGVSELVAITKEKNGEYRFVGLAVNTDGSLSGAGLRQQGGAWDTGASIGDANSANVNLQAGNSGYSYKVDTSVITTLGL